VELRSVWVLVGLTEILAITPISWHMSQNLRLLSEVSEEKLELPERLTLDITIKRLVVMDPIKPME
jgi:hypothetical protein